MEPVNVRVSDKCGAYVTQTVRGQRASSTGGAQFAVQALATKLFPCHVCAVRQLPAKGLKAGDSMWRIDPQ
jgi:hypothetical protein